ncbi:MAG: DUF3352 domain-containing protein [Rubripirellula sp.]|nr:DUF3352 domain-containing protein [Rubripirellula sp.]
MNTKFLTIAGTSRVLLLGMTWVTLTAFLAPARAQEKEIPGAPRLLPSDTLAYIRLDNAEQFRKDFGDSSVGQMLNDPALKPLSSDVYQMMSELFEQVGTILEVSLDDLLAIPQGQVAAAMMPGNLSEYQEELAAEEEDDESPEAIRRRLARKRREQNSLAGVFLMEADKNVETLMGLMEKMEQRVTTRGYLRRSADINGIKLIKLLPPRPGRPEIEYFEKDGTVVMGIGHDTAAKVLDHWADRSEEETLADRSDFVSIMSRCVGAESTRPQLTFFVDPYRIIERFVKRSSGAALVWPIVEQLGLPKIRGIGGSSFSGGELFESISHMHILVDPPRDGVLGVLRPEAVDSAPPNWVPADVASYTSLKWDFETTYDNLDKVVAKFQGEGPMKRFVEDPAMQQFGISIREDLLENITGRYVNCGWIEPSAKLNSRTQTHALELSDSLKAKDVIAKFRERRPNALTVETIGGTVVYFARSPSGGNLPENFRIPEPGLMILGKWLIFSDSREMLTRITRANLEAAPRLINVAEFELVTSELGGKLDGEKPFMVSFLRGAEYMKQVYDLAKSPETKGMLRQASTNAPFAGKVVSMLDRNQLPDFKEFEKYFAPSGTFAYDEPAGIHFGSFTLRAEDE